MLVEIIRQLDTSCISKMSTDISSFELLMTPRKQIRGLAKIKVRSVFVSMQRQILVWSFIKTISRKAECSGPYLMAVD
jgi:hypothetical protein